MLSIRTSKNFRLSQDYFANEPTLRNQEPKTIQEKISFALFIDRVDRENLDNLPSKNFISKQTNQDSNILSVVQFLKKLCI